MAASCTGDPSTWRPPRSRSSPHPMRHRSRHCRHSWPAVEHTVPLYCSGNSRQDTCRRRREPGYRTQHHRLCPAAILPSRTGASASVASAISVSGFVPIPVRIASIAVLVALSTPCAPSLEAIASRMARVNVIGR